MFSIQAENVELLLVEGLRVPRLSEKVVREAVTEFMEFGTVLSAFLQYNVQYIQRYIYFKV